MVSLTQVQDTNSTAGRALPPDLVAVFSGATTGIGALSMRAFARYAARPRIYFVGRSQERGSLLVKEMEEASSGGHYVFIKADLSMMSNVDRVCEEIKEKEKAVNLLFMTQGTLKIGEDTSEGLPYMTSVVLYSRFRLAPNLLPLLRQGSTLCRVVSVYAGGKEGPLYIDDIGWRGPAWLSDPHVRAEIETYRQKIKGFLHNDALHPWVEDIPAVESRLQILDLKEGHHDFPATEFHSPQDTLQYLENALSSPSSTEPSRHLILMEGMNPRLAEVLGVRLGIPPEFWLSHWGHHGRLGVFDPSFRNQDSSTYWKVQVPQLRLVSEDLSRPEGGYTVQLGYCARGTTYCDAQEKQTCVSSVVSYWGGKLAENSWIALVLVDSPTGHLTPRFLPPLGFTRSALSKTPTQTVADDNPFDVASNPSSHRPGTVYPSNTPLWDKLVEAYKAEKTLSTEDPFSATITVRNIISSAWETKTKYDMNRLNMVWMIPHDYLPAFNVVNPDQELIKQTSTSIEYEKLVERRHSAQQNKAQIEEIIRAFRRDNFEFSSSRQDSRLWLAKSNEARRWRDLYNQYQWMDTTMAENMTMYDHGTATEDAFATQIQAIDTYRQTVAFYEETAPADPMVRGSGQLARIATVAVPCIIIASIFSMNGNFAAWERLLFVYWCVVVPMTLLLLGWVMQKDIVALVVKMEERWKGITTDRPTPSFSYFD
ncbi:hypothetical protein NM208_g6766 [Fusarium decemcellulare]|uniref:Uncharacterized protein n=1 Tax=Fusarium decemcellulare TaxID=57161 RepID=A0ACC1SBT4_9HYPO|nr:hypothetical protein NM208_g6766 [Fusarium decemcellulare]